MDSENSGKDSDVDRWIELGNLGLEKSLLKSGVPQEKVSRITTLLQQRRGVFSDLNAFLGVEDGVCIFLATLGRDSENNTGSSIPNIKNLHVSENVVVFNDVQFTEVTIGHRELGALWVNLLRNPKISKLAIYFDLTAWENPRKENSRQETSKAFTYKGELNPLTFARYEKALTQQPKTFLRVVEGYDHENEHTLIVRVEALSTLIEQTVSPKCFPVSAVSRSIDLVAGMVSTTTTLRDLIVGYISNLEPLDDSEADDDDFGEKLANALRKNTSLKTFVLQPSLVSIWPSARLRETLAGTLLAAFAQENEGSHDHHDRHNIPNRTITRLSLPFVSSIGMGTLCSVLRTNKTLKAIGLQSSDFLPQEWAQKILDSLRGNDRLEVLDLSNSKGLTEDDVFDPLMNLLQFTNTGLKSITLHGTELVHKQSTVDEELRVNQEYRTSLASEDKITPTTGRIVLCGFPFAGKTSICRTLQKQDLRFTGWKSFLQKNPRLRQLLCGRGVHQELHNRTRGLDVTFRGKPPDITSIWDFGGQEEFYVLHDYLFPNAGNSCFLYVCSARHPPNGDHDGYRVVKEDGDIEVEFRFWMRFIASNFKHLKDKKGQTHRPHVTFVMTHLDSLDDGERRRFKGLAERVVADFRVEFGAFLNISEKAVFIDARFPESVENLFAGSERHLKAILDNSEEYKVCSEVRDALQWELIRHPYRYIFDLEQVRRICACQPLLRQLQKLGGQAAMGEKNLIREPFQAGLNIVLKYLNDVGDIIFVEGLNFIIVQVTWFGREVLGHLIDPFQKSRAELKARTGILGCLRKTPEMTAEETGTLDSKNGFVRRSSLERFLEDSLRRISSNGANLSGSLIDLMVHLELCFEELPEDEGTPSPNPSFFFPALLDDNSDHVHASSSPGALQWTVNLNARRNSICYVGRRLECSDELTFLTPGFFPRLQVVLVNYFRKNWPLSTCSKNFSVSRNIIRFAHDGMEIIVEYSKIGYFVDVLVRSTKAFRKALKFIEDHVVKRILEFCSSPQGCQGVDLVEAIIRPACVERLSSCEERRHHSVLVSYLKSQEPDYVHTWEKMPGASDCDSAADLLHGPRTMSTMRSGEDLPNKMKGSEVPTKFYFTIEDVGAVHKMNARMNTAKMLALKLHIFCDGTDANELHAIDGQPGRVLHVPEDSKSFNLPILNLASHMLFEGARIGAGLFNVHTPTFVDKFFENPRSTAVLDIGINELKELEKITGECSPEDILGILETYSSLCPESEWWKQFLNLQNFSDFRQDFQLTRVSNPSTKEVSWVCDDCRRELWPSYRK